MEPFEKFRDDWRRARASLVDQRELMKRDPVFPEVTMGAERREALSAKLDKFIKEYDDLLREYDLGG